MDEMLPHEEVVRRIDAVWMQWLQSIGGIDTRDMTKPGASGAWSPADLTFHIAFGDERAGYDMSVPAR